MIYYGYPIENAWGLSEDTQDHSMMTTCYSVSAFEPEAGFFGYEVDSRSCIFWPIAIPSDLGNHLITQEQKIEVEEAFKNLPKNEQEKFVTSAPGFYMFENTDD